MAGDKIAPTLGDALVIGPTGGDTVAGDADQPIPVADDECLDPKTSARRYWRDPLSGTQREIWRPGDGDGEIEHDHYERKGPIAPLDKRWRLYQLPGPFKARIKEPPANVILDDRAVYEVLQSNIPRAQLSKRWSHDFSGQAAVRHRRAHRGRPAYKDEKAEDNVDNYHYFKPSGKNAPLYYFSGEKDFTPVFYHDLPPADETPEAEEDEDDDDDDGPIKPKQHNQYTAPELLVRNGAQSASLTKGKYRSRVNTFLRRSPSPPWVKDRQKLFGGVGIGRAATNTPDNSTKPSNFGFSFALAPSLTGPTPGESMWVEQDEDTPFEGDDEDEIQPSVFDAPTEETGDFRGNGTSNIPVNPLKRSASSKFSSSRPKAPREMGYIERLAAGLLQEDMEATADEQLMEDAVPRDTDAERQDRVDLLERELEAANSTILSRDNEISALKSQLEQMQRQLAMRESADDVREATRGA